MRVVKTRIMWHIHFHQEYDEDGVTIRSVPCHCPWIEEDNPHMVLCLIGDRWSAWV